MFNVEDADKCRTKAIQILDALEYGTITTEGCDDLVEVIDKYIKQIQVIRRYYKEED